MYIRVGKSVSHECVDGSLTAEQSRQEVGATFPPGPLEIQGREGGGAAAGDGGALRDRLPHFVTPGLTRGPASYRSGRHIGQVARLTVAHRAKFLAR